MVIILHNIRSLHNVGSIFRTADAVGVVKIYLCGITPSPLDQFGKLRPQFAKTALGAERYVSWQKVKSTTKLIDGLKNEGYTILAIEQSRKSIPYHRTKIKPREKLALVLGAEVKGLPASILKKADRILEIPMTGRKESLNVAVAFGIAAYGLKFGK